MIEFLEMFVNMFVMAGWLEMNELNNLQLLTRTISLEWRKLNITLMIGR